MIDYKIDQHDELRLFGDTSWHADAFTSGFQTAKSWYARLPEAHRFTARIVTGIDEECPTIFSKLEKASWRAGWQYYADNRLALLFLMKEGFYD
jgi:hypothetical protein